MAKKINARRSGTKVQFECRLSFSHLDEPWGQDDNPKKYSVTCIIPKSDEQTMDEIMAAIEEAKKIGKDKCWKGVIPKKFRNLPIHDGDAESDAECYKDAWYFGASSKDAVPVFNRLRERIDPKDAYSGCYALVEVNWYPYDRQGAGVAAGLNQVLKLRDGDPLGGKGTADAFSAFDELDEFDDDNDF